MTFTFSAMTKMVRRCSCAALVLAATIPLHGQTPTPARPVDPNQPMPAQPVTPATPVPVMPAKPATPPPTNAPSATSTTSASTGTNAPPAVTLTVLADTSLKKVLQELAQNWADNQPDSPQVPLSLANAGTIRTKVMNGEAWDVVISADIDDVKAMTDKGLLVAVGQRSLARNTLVIYGRHALIKDDDLDWFDLIGSEWKRVAFGNPDFSASGRVAKRALDKHDLYGEDARKMYTVAPNEDKVVGVLEREQADAIFVYKTDLAGINLPGFEVYPLAPEDAPPVFYVASIGTKSKKAALAQSFLDYLSGEAARPIWQKYGFETD